MAIPTALFLEDVQIPVLRRYDTDEVVVCFEGVQVAVSRLDILTESPQMSETYRRARIASNVRPPAALSDSRLWC